MSTHVHESVLANRKIALRKLDEERCVSAQGSRKRARGEGGIVC
jgi:hypothetical protein